MHPYIPHLLDDIAAAHRNELPEPIPHTPQTFEEEMEEIEQWVAGEEAPHSFSYYCGLKPEEFPPAAQLTPEEMLIVCKTFRQMMFSWNLSADFPETLPPDRDYELLVNTLNEKTDIPSFGFMHFDYCSGYAPDCVFKEYCACLKYWNEDEEDASPENVDEELPF